MYPKTFFTISFLAFSFLFLANCENNNAPQDQSKIAANFYVRYLAENQELRGQASFFQDDSTTLVVPGGLAFMGSGTQQKELPGKVVRYEGKMRIPFPNPTRFTFVLPEQDVPTEVSLPMTGIDQFSVNSASLSDGLRLSVGTTLAADESLLLLFTDPNQEVRTIVRPGPWERKDLFIPADAVALFTPGSYRLYLVKSRQIVDQIKGLSFEASVEYYTGEEAFELKR